MTATHSRSTAHRGRLDGQGLPDRAAAADVNAGQSNNTWLGAPSLKRRPAYWLICSESLWFQEDCRPLVSLAFCNRAMVVRSAGFERSSIRTTSQWCLDNPLLSRQLAASLLVA